MPDALFYTLALLYVAVFIGLLLAEINARVPFFSDAFQWLADALTRAARAADRALPRIRVRRRARHAR